jgi:hypothetical protein
MLAGGLFLGMPTAAAAPGDAACLQASGQFHTALAESGITAVSVEQLEVAVAALTAAEDAYFALIDTVGAEASAALDAGYAVWEGADKALLDAEEALAAAEATGDPAAIATAEKAVADAELAWNAADAELTRLEDAYDTVLDTPEINAAFQVLVTAEAGFEAALGGITLTEESAAQLVNLFQAFLTACEGQTGAAPVVVPPAALPVPPAAVPAPAPAPPVSAPVTVAPVPVAPAPVRTNVGLNIQTAAPAGEDQPGAALLAGLLAAGIAVPAAVAVRLRRQARTGS